MTAKPEMSTRVVTRLVASHLFARSAVLIVPECAWTGHECDALVVTRHLRIIDLEIKRSRADLMADAAKGKWWRRTTPRQWDARIPGPRTRRVALDWPPQVWKHWYAVEAPVWRDSALAQLPDASGVLTFVCRPRTIAVQVIRQPRPNRAVAPLGTTALIDLCRLSNLRLWDLYLTAEGF